MAEVSIAIFGLQRVGASIGLALKRYNAEGKEHTFTISGYDTGSANVKEGQRLEAVDKVSNRPEEIAADKDIIVLAMPYGEVDAIYEMIAHRLRPGAVIIDLSILKDRSLQWAQKNLPEDNHLVCGMPVVNPKYLFDPADETKRASADYFDDGTFMLMPSVSCVREAITLTSDFATILGSKPHFFDPHEHDALVAGTDVLPSVLGVLYYEILRRNSGWNDGQRLVNPVAGAVSHHLFDTHPDDMRDTWLDSGENLIRYIDEMVDSLRNLRAVLADKDRDAVESVLEKSSQSYEAWINRRYRNRWQDDENLDSDTPSFGGMMGNMIGGFVGNRLTGNKKKKDD